MTDAAVFKADPRQHDYVNEGPRNSQLWDHRYILFLEDVTAVFDGFKALDIVDWGIGHNELRVVVGPNGAGKTTMCDVVSGLTRPATGKVYFNSKEITRRKEADIAQMGVGRKFQIPNVFDSLTVYENLLLALPNPVDGFGPHEWRRVDPRLQGPGGIALIKLVEGIKNIGGRGTRDAKARIDAILERVRLIGERETIAKNLSHGQRQWLAISSLILSNPKLLLVDEPAAGLTDAETELTAELLLELKDDHSLIVIEHDMDFVRQLGSYVTVLNEGKVMAEGTMDEIETNPDVVEAYLGR